MTNYWQDPYYEAYEVDPQASPLDLIDAVFHHSFSIPEKEIQTSLMKAAIITPSKYSSVLPLFVCYGPSGTGKSQLGKLVAGLYQLPPNYLLAGKTTSTAIRNLIQLQKYGEGWQEGGHTEESNCILVWDDINLDILKDAQLLSILKSGYSRKSSNIAIAVSGGEIMFFDCFSQKFTSTIHPFWIYGEFVELLRRVLIFPHCQYHDFSAEDKEKNLNPENLIDIDYVSFEGYRGMKSLEPDVVELEKLQKARRNLRRHLKDSQVPTDFGKLCYDLLCFGSTFGVWPDLQRAVDNLEKFYSTMKSSLDERTEFDYWLDRYLDQYVKEESSLLQTKLGEPISLPRKRLQKAIEIAIAEKEIPNQKYELAKVMKVRGWKLVSSNTNNFEKIVG